MSVAPSSPATGNRSSGATLISRDRGHSAVRISNRLGGAVCPLVEVPEDRFTICVLGNDHSPVLNAALARSPLGEPIELSGSVQTVVSTLTTATPALVLEVPLEGILQQWRCAFFNDSVVHHSVSGARESSR